MGRLFWKIFFAFWLAQLAAGMGAGAAVWWWYQASDGQGPWASHRHADPFLDAAQAVFLHGGVAALRELLVDRQDTAASSNTAAPPIYAVDESGQDILGREPPPASLAQARLSAESAGLGARLVAADDGHAYLLFASAGDAPGGDMPLPEGLAPGSGPSPGLPLSPAILAAAGGLASLLFSAWLAWYWTRPVRHLRVAFDALADGKLDTRVGPVMGGRQDELSGLGQSFDHMAGRIDGLVDTQWRLLHDVSHELRSPLARMQAAIGLARQQPDKIGMSLERLEQEAECLDTLIGELLTLSHMEADVSDVKKETIDMAVLLGEVVAELRFEAEAKGVRVECDFSDVVFIRGRKELIRRATENVIRNAVQHTPADSAVIVDGKFDEERGALRLRVSDQGPGVPEDQLLAIFKPFFRGAGQAGGVGLGLSIARRAIEAHGGKIGARNRAKGGLCVEWTFPVAKAAK